MKITFQTKAESNAAQEKEFLALSGAERLLRFMSLSNAILKLPRKNHIKDDRGNFVLEKRK
ncbi:MAG: hypothetical protein ACSHWW_11335 [Nonlabens sp.]|uniref:hypothetical protein n=1 Tax=Nonlabens sp. TaxID=1888209 RepID=UPI003EF3EF44